MRRSQGGVACDRLLFAASLSRALLRWLPPGATQIRVLPPALPPKKKPTGSAYRTGRDAQARSQADADDRPGVEDGSDVAAQKNKPLGSDLYVHAARVYEKKGQFDAAEDQYLRALELNSNDTAAISGYASVWIGKASSKPPPTSTARSSPCSRRTPRRTTIWACATRGAA